MRSVSRLLGVWALVHAICTVGHAQCMDFSARLYPAGVNPAGVVAADVNHDGLIDVIVANRTSGDISVLLGTSVGSFRDPVSTPVGQSAQAIAARDLNGDGNLDLVIADMSSNAVVVMVGDAVGGFLSTGALAVGASPRSLAIGDINHDGHPDIAVGNYTDSTLSLLLNDGQGRFSAPETVPLTAKPRAIAMGDFNGDGDPDLAVSIESGQGAVAVLLNDGGRFPTAVRYSDADAFGLVAADVDGDADVDLLVGGGGYVGLLRNTGAGAFAPVVLSLVTPATSSIAAADFDGDGDLDVAASVNDPSVRSGLAILLNNGSGGLSQAPFIQGGAAASAVVAADINGDGRPDVVQINSAGPGVTAYANAGNAAFPTFRELSMPGAPEAVAVGDLDRDGVQDIVAAQTGTNSITVLRGLGGGAYLRVAVLSGAFRARWCRLVDLNADGLLDIVATGDGPASVSLNAGAATFSGLVQVGAPVGSPMWLAIGDVDGDNDPDFVMNYHDYFNRGYVFLNDGAGAFVQGQQFDDGSGVGGVGLIDVDGDGRLDFLELRDSGVVVVRRNNGQGVFTHTADYPFPGLPRWITVCDLNGDGHGDAIVCHAAQSLLQVRFGDASGHLGDLVTYRPAVAPGAMVVADMNGDGWPDIVSINTNRAACLFINDRLGGLTDARYLLAGGGSKGVAIGDMNADGLPDVITSNTTANTLTIMPNIGLPPPVITSSPEDVSVCGVADAAFRVAAAGAHLEYRWRRDGVPLVDGDGVSGAGTSALLLEPATDRTGRYDCVVSNGCGQVTSDAAALNVCAPDWNCDGFLDFFDYGDFVAAFETGVGNADFNGDGFVDFFDYGDFVAAFETGC